jgi:hypothetical protein
MHLSQARFTVFHCYVTIDGWPADIETKLSLLMEGVCSVKCQDMEHDEQARALHQTRCGQDKNVFGCNDPRLVELAARYRLWGDAGGGPDEEVEILDEPAARVALMRHLAVLSEDADPAIKSSSLSE